MDFVLSDDQEALRDGIASLCAGRFGMERVRNGFDASMWTELHDAGVFTLRDLALGTPEEAVVFEELGRALVPGPLVWGALATPVDGVVSGMEYGVATHLDASEGIYVIRDDHIGYAAGASGIPIESPLDPLTPMTRVDATWLTTTLVPGDVMEWRYRGATLTAAYLVGMASAVTDLAVAYAKERVQFDQPIGKFQAIKHLLADNFVRAEVARAAVHAAAVEPTARSVGVAKVLAGDAAIANAKTAFQVHGGMGFTWEVDVHLYLKRAWVLDRQFGSADAHAHALSASS